MVSGFTFAYSSSSPAAPTSAAKTSVCSDVSSPRGNGRPRVRAIKRVDLLLDQAIDRGGRTGDQRDTEGAEYHDVDGRRARRGQKHADHRGENDQRYDARLGQREELAKAAFGKREGGHRCGVGRRA